MKIIWTYPWEEEALLLNKMTEHEILEVAVSLGGEKHIWKLNLDAIWCG